MSDIKGRFIVAAISWVGTPFGLQGRLKGIRVDCVGLVIGAAKEIGYVPEDWDFTEYQATGNDEVARKWLGEWCQPIKPKQITPGDIAVFSANQGAATHVGIVYNHVDGLGVIHADEKLGHVVMHRMDARYLSTIVAGFRLKENE